MTQQSLLDLALAAVFAWAVEAQPVVLGGHGPRQDSERRAGLAAEPRQWGGPPWSFPIVPTTAATLTVSPSGATSSTSFLPTIHPGSDEAQGTATCLLASHSTVPPITDDLEYSSTVDQ